MNKDTQLTNGAIPISVDDYNKIKSKEYKRDVKSEIVFKELLGDVYNKYIKLLGFVPNIYINSSDTFKVRAWVVCRLGLRSVANGRSDLDDDNGRFVGQKLATKLQVVKKVKDTQVVPEIIKYHGRRYILEK